MKLTFIVSSKESKWLYSTKVKLIVSNFHNFKQYRQERDLCMVDVNLEDNEKDSWVKLIQSTEY